LGNALGRSLSPSSNSSWCICFTDPCGSRRKPIADKRNVVVDGIGGEVLSEALEALALGGSLTTLGYSASRKTTLDVTDLIVSQASIRSLNMAVTNARCRPVGGERIEESRHGNKEKRFRAILQKSAKVFHWNSAR
jgi:NADPH:quinone reductase-like Zn-dependent oxidoreductase